MTPELQKHRWKMNQLGNRCYIISENGKIINSVYKVVATPGTGWQPGNDELWKFREWNGADEISFETLDAAKFFAERTYMFGGGGEVRQAEFLESEARESAEYEERRARARARQSWLWRIFHRN